jgi:hypothetical protein
VAVAVCEVRFSGLGLTAHQRLPVKERVEDGRGATHSSDPIMGGGISKKSNETLVAKSSSSASSAVRTTLQVVSSQGLVAILHVCKLLLEIIYYRTLNFILAINYK